MDSAARHLGITGLATMGQNLARNIARHGFPIAVHNRTVERVDHFVQSFSDEGDIVGCHSLEEFVSSLEKPRSIIVMVKAGAGVDQVIDALVPLLEPGDLIVDAGNSYFADTERRAAALEVKGLQYLGCGVSGGEEGALLGPSIMPGGTRSGYAAVEEVLTAIAAVVDGTPCCSYIGAGGSGHFVKMVHNGIEYADMQLIAEAYDLLHRGLGLPNSRLAEIFDDWNSGDLDSFLIDITARIFRTVDDRGEGDLVDAVLDRAEQKGTGRWTAESALGLGVPGTVITEAVYARALSSLKSERLAAAELLAGPSGKLQVADPENFLDDVRSALYASKVVAYAQGFSQLAAAAVEYGWKLDLGNIASLWRGGCIIRARFLDRITEAYSKEPELGNLMLAPYFAEALEAAQDSWRRVVSSAATAGVAAPAFSSALAYYDGYRSARLPANLIQAQRDLFGAHTYERTDQEGYFHSIWAES